MSNVTNMPTSVEIENDKLLVDYVLNHMSDSEKAAFEEKMTSDPELKAQVDRELLLKDDILNAFSDKISRHDVSAASFQSTDFIRREESDTSRASDQFANREPTHSRSLQWLVASAAMFVVTFFVLGQFDQAPVAEYEGLSSDVSVSTIEFTEQHYAIVFDSSFDQAQRNQLAAEMNFEIVSGPGAGNTFIIKTNEPLNKDLKRQWLGHPGIDFLEPAR